MSLFSAINRIKPLNLMKQPAFTILANQITTKLSSLEEVSEAKKVKKPPVPKITLISSDNVSVTTLEDARKISKRRDLKLVKLLDIDTKTQRPVYKLMTGSEYHAEDLKQREEKKKDKLSSTAIKGEKVLILSSNITEHDLTTHLNKIAKWVAKRFEVRVVINGDGNNMEKAEKVFAFLEEKIKDSGRILQKRQKGNDLKCQIIPPKRDKDSDDNS